MKKATCFLAVILISGSLISCSDNPTQSIAEVVEAEISNGKLSVFNKSESDIYFFAIEREFAAMANWEPTSGEENRIQSNFGEEVDLSAVSNYEPGKTIIFYYWRTEQPTSADIENVLVD